MVMSEYLTVRRESDRGEHWVDASPGLSALYLHDTPNSPSPDHLYLSTCGDGPPFGIGNLPAENLPCFAAVDDNINYWAAARSHHPGSVNALFCDGSVHNISQTIALLTWQNLEYIVDGFPPGDF
jgi:prepilin-type processing-associated H-X9-DG protein